MFTATVNLRCPLMSNVHSYAGQRSAQHGIALITVLVMMLLTSLLILGAARVGFISEKVAGNNADYQRAYEAAEALMSEARLDLACLSSGCGIRTGTIQQFSCDDQSFEDMKDSLSASTPPCKNGICTDLGTAVSGDPATSFWNNDAQFTQFTATGVAAKFGEFTNTTVSAGTAVNPLLQTNAWYWIEILPYGGTGGGGRSVISEQTFAADSVLKPDRNCEYVFRITTAARGRKPGTAAVLQSFFFFRPA
jgi:type IV pilus assembly protein PilX